MVEKTTTVGVIGYGFVGRAVATLECVAPVNIYDVANDKYNSRKQRKEAYNSDIVFINVPTDLEDDRLCCSIIHSCLRKYLLEKRTTTQNTIVIKSTIPVGLCEELSTLYDLKNLVFNPEFLSQRTALWDFMNQKEVYLGGAKDHTNKVRRLYEEYFRYVDNTKVVFVESPKYKEIELLKLARNTFYGLKVSYCNNLYNLCQKEGIDYASFRGHFARADWVGQQHTLVPGPDGQLGYGGKCLPKDSIELLNFCKSRGIIFEILEESILFNNLQRSKKCQPK